MVRRFLYQQLNPDSSTSDSESRPDEYLNCHGDMMIKIYYSAVATFRAPSDPSGVTGMHREHIRATPSWRNAPRFDCVLVSVDPDLQGMIGLEVARIQAFFSFVHEQRRYQCALIHWFSRIGTGPDADTGMWLVEPDYEDGEPNLAIIHVDTIFRAAHLLPAHRSNQFVARHVITMHNSLDRYDQFYVNRFVDYHAFEVLF